MLARTQEPGFFELFTPKLFTVLKADALAGLTVAIIALPLSMAIAIASGVTPERGLYTSIVGGFFVSALGGSRFQIGGPAGAFIVLVLATVQTHGVDGLILATFLSGLIMLAVGFLRLGTFIKYVPYPVTVGFTSGIAVIILTSQLKDFLGLTLDGQEPGPFIPKLQALGAALPTLNPPAVGIAIFAAAIIILLRRYRPHWPGFLIAVVFSTLMAWAFALPIETIGTRFGGIPESLPLPHLPDLTPEKVIAVLPAALSFALLGSIESLLSAVVADSMSGRRHRSNAELVAQGTANIASSLFGGICVTGTIARTAANVRAGARGPVAGMLHALFLLVFMLIAAPLARFIPLSALAAILVVVAWNMAEKHQFAALLRSSRGDALVLLVTFLLVVFRDLTEGIVVGFSLGALLFLHRMSKAIEVNHAHPVVELDKPDDAPNGAPYPVALRTDEDIVVYRITGAFFFGAAASVATALDRIGGQPKAYIVDISAVEVLDSTAAATIEGFARKAGGQGAKIYLVGATTPMRHLLHKHGLHAPQVRFYSGLDAAVMAARRK